MKKILICASLCIATVALDAYAQVKPETQVKQRRSAMSVISFNFSSLAAMAQEKKPYNKDEAAKNADIVAALAEYPKMHFGEGTDKVGDTKAKPEVWQKKADFDTKMDKMASEAHKLPAAARADLASLKKVVSDMAKACDSCHDDYRTK